MSALTSRSNVSLCWQGRYEILSLSGSYLLQDTGGGARQRTGGLSVSLAATDGRVIGGSVAGLLVAASPIQVSMQDGDFCRWGSSMYKTVVALASLWSIPISVFM